MGTVAGEQWVWGSPFAYLSITVTLGTVLKMAVILLIEVGGALGLY